MNYTYFVDTSLDNSQSQELDTSSQEEPSQEDAPAAEAEPVQYNSVFFAQMSFLCKSSNNRQLSQNEVEGADKLTFELIYMEKGGQKLVYTLKL